MGPDPRVLVVAAGDDLAGPLCRGLDALGWRTMTARTGAAAAAAMADLAFEAAILDVNGAASADVATLKAAAGPRALPVMILGEPRSEFPDADLAMTASAHPTQVARRLEQLVRAAVAEEEFVIRRQTFDAHQMTLEVIDPLATPLRILAAGAPDRRFLALSNALAEAGAETVAAPTPYTAFDYLHESPFDAVVLWGGLDPAPALSIASGMKRNTRLFHIPLVLHLREASDRDLAEIYNRGIADVAGAETPESETAERVLTLAHAFRRQQAVRRALENARGSDLMDPATGLFTPEVFASHLGRVAQMARARRRPLSICVLKVANTHDLAAARECGWLGRAMPQIGAMVSRLVRAEDTAARLAPDVFALALPATRNEAARQAAARIAAVIGCTAFDAGPGQTPFVVEFEVGSAELAPGESPGGLLERASADLAARSGGKS